METVTSRDGTPIAYERSGEGSPLVLVHGMVATIRGWDLVLLGLQEHFTVCAMVRRGRGGSGDAADYSLDREVEDVVAVVDSTDGPVNLLGHSYGAILALEAALRRTDRVRRLVLYEGASPFPKAPSYTAPRPSTASGRGWRRATKKGRSSPSTATS